MTDRNERVATSALGRKFAPNHGLVRAIAATKLSIFTPISDLGYYGWNPEGAYKSLSDVTKVGIKKSLDVDRKPAEMVSLQEILPKLPLPFAKIQAQEHTNKYPYNPPHVVPLRVALRYRGVQRKDVKFLFHGSTLEMLASATIAEGTNYIAAVFPGTEIMLVASHKEYVQNYSQIGFQFERLVTGKAFADRHDVATAYHLQLMDVSGHAVLFSAEVDALDSMNDPVEVTCSNSFHWGSRVMFQMLSNGSLTLCHGLKRPGELYSIQIEHFNKVTSDALTGSSAVQLEENIKAGMETLLKELKRGRFDNGGVFKVHFVASELRLTPFTAAEIFTNPSVIQGLIS